MLGNELTRSALEASCLLQQPSSQAVASQEEHAEGAAEEEAAAGGEAAEGADEAGGQAEAEGESEAEEADAEAALVANLASAGTDPLQAYDAIDVSEEAAALQQFLTDVRQRLAAAQVDV